MHHMLVRNLTSMLLVSIFRIQKITFTVNIIIFSIAFYFLLSRMHVKCFLFSQVSPAKRNSAINAWDILRATEAEVFVCVITLYLCLSVETIH